MTRSAFAAFAAAITLAACAESGTSYLSIATAGTGGIYYPLGGALANYLSAADPAHRYTAEVTGGSVENINRLHNGEVDIAMAIATTIDEAYKGGTDFPAAHTALRILAPLYPNVTHVLVRGASRIESIAALRGLRVSIGAAGSGTEQLARHVLEAYGLAPSDVQLQYLSFTESAAALRDGAIDAAIISVGYPASAVLEATTTGSARLLPIDGDAARTMMDRYSYYLASRIPAGAYRGVDADIATIGVMNWIVANESLDSTVATHVLNVLRNQRDALIRVHDIARQIDFAALHRAPIPRHAAAAAWLRDAVSPSAPAPSEARD
jgi:TRAP transporter TAXI family solute receptor